MMNSSNDTRESVRRADSLEILELSLDQDQAL